MRIPLENELLRRAAEIGVLPYIEPADELITEVSAMRIGEAMFAAFPGEPLPKLGLRVKEQMRAKYRFVVGLASDEIGYILPEEDFHREIYSYESSMSVGPKAGPIIMEALESLIHQLAQ